MPRVEVASAEASSTAACLAAVDTMRHLSRHQCAHDLVEEYVCAKFVLLHQGQAWFEVRDDAKYESRGLKFLKLDLLSLWRRVVDKGRTSAEGVAAVLDIVKKESKDLVGPLMTPKLKLIKKALDSRHRVNRCFDLLGVAYPDWPSLDVSGSEAGVKRKRGSAGAREGGAPKRGRGGRGRGSSVDRPVVANVSRSRTVVPTPKPVAPVVSTPTVPGASHWTRPVPGLATVPIVDIGLDDDDDERVAEEAEDEEKVESGSSSDSSSEGSGDADDSVGDEGFQADDDDGLALGASQELGPDGGDLVGGHEMVRVDTSHPTTPATCFKQRRVHIF